MDERSLLIEINGLSVLSHSRSAVCENKQKNRNLQHIRRLKVGSSESSFGIKKADDLKENIWRCWLWYLVFSLSWMSSMDMRPTPYGPRWTIVKKKSCMTQLHIFSSNSQWGMTQILLGNNPPLLATSVCGGAGETGQCSSVSALGRQARYV